MALGRPQAALGSPRLTMSPAMYFVIVGVCTCGNWSVGAEGRL
jgi:hypothetical protein